MIIDFEIEKDGYKLKDAIHLPDNHKLTEQEIEQIKQKRFDDWYAIVSAPSEDTVEEE
jgi:hypothetical protein